MTIAAALLALTLQAAPSPLDAALPGEPAESRRAAIEAMGRSGDDRFVPPLLDLLAFADTRDEWFLVLDALGAITGLETRSIERPWRTLSERRFAQGDRSKPDGYASFKRELLARRVDPKFRALLPAADGAFDELDHVAWGGVPADGIPALDRPPHVAADRATFLSPDDPVFGVAFDGAARAYPTRILDWHEMVNDVVGGQPFALSWCTLCGAPVAFDTGIDGGARRMGSSGLLLRSNKLMFDRDSSSLWSQLTGAAVAGPMKDAGARLEVLPVVSTTWARWRSEHPDTTVVSRETGFDRDYSPGAAYGDEHSTASTMFPVPRGERRFEAKQRIALVGLGRATRAVSLDELERHGRVTLEVDERRVVVELRGRERSVVLPQAWRDAIEDAGGDPESPTADDLAAARLAGGTALPPWTVAGATSLPRATRRALLAGRIEGVTLSDDVRRQVAPRHLVADVRAEDAESGRAVPVRLAFGFVWDAHFASGRRGEGDGD